MACIIEQPHWRENMDADCIAVLYRSLGLCVGAEFSSEDVTLLYRKVFHVPSDTEEAHAAMQKIAGGDDSWSCVGENVLDVLLEMEREREKKEKLYWDLQLLNVGALNTLHETNNPVPSRSRALNCLHQSTKPNTWINAPNQSDSACVHPGSSDTHSLRRGPLLEGKDLYESVKAVRRLKKAARHCWARLASEGVQGVLLPSLWQGQSPEVRGQAWGCVTLSDVLQLVDVKYDVVTHLLYTEMLQEHHTLTNWENMLPWQRHIEEEGLEDLAEEALELGDMLRLAELPGAFRIYRACLGASVRSYPESRECSWSAVSLLCDLHTFHQQERDTLAVLSERLDGENLTLLCLHIRLAILRAQREKMSYRALVAARQSWDTWPHVKSPCRADQAALWLYGEDEEQPRDPISKSPQQALLQLLLLTQEQERMHLLKLLHGVSLEELQEPDIRPPSEKENEEQAALRNGCITKLRQVRAALQTHSTTQTQAQIQADLWSQDQLEDCSLVLLTKLVELQEVQASAVLSALLDKSPQRVQTLRDEFESELGAQHYTNALQLLIPDAPLTSGSVVTPHPTLTENSVTVQTAARGAQAEDGTDKADVCSGCGAVIEVLPYLEILCGSDAATNNTSQSLAAEGGAQLEDRGGETKSPQSYQKQGSLIPLAWSKPPEDNTDHEAEAAGDDCLRTQTQPSDVCSSSEHIQVEETSGERDKDCLKPMLILSESTGPSAEQQCSTIRKQTVEDGAAADRPEEREAASERDLPLNALVAEAPATGQPHLSADPEIQWHAGDLGSGTTSTVVHAEREVSEVEMWPNALESEPGDLRGPGPPQKHNAQGKFHCSPAEREPTLMEGETDTELVSAIERERTMRNLVDMQKKVEQRQQRDRERQLLRVQERLSIIQNRKAEEDLLGLKHTDRLRHLTQDLPQEDKNQQKTVVRERLEQLRRERSYAMQSKRDRNTAGFKELLGPVVLQGRDPDNGAD